METTRMPLAGLVPEPAGREMASLVQGQAALVLALQAGLVGRARDRAPGLGATAEGWMGACLAEIEAGRPAGAAQAAGLLAGLGEHLARGDAPKP